MPPRAKKAPTGEPVASTMKELKDTLWKAADKLRGSMDASQYKDVILGLVFLKYVSDAFDERREQIRAELLGRRAATRTRSTSFLDDVDEYTGHGVFWVPANARWTYLAENAKGLRRRPTPAKSIGQLIDEAMDSIMGANSVLTGTLPTHLQPGQRRPAPARRTARPVQRRPVHRPGREARPATCSARCTSTSWRSSPAPRASAAASSTPRPASCGCSSRCWSRTRGRVYDPCCGSGGMFVQAEKFLEAHDGEGSDISVYGQELNERTWRHGQDEPRHPRHQRQPRPPAGATPSPATSTPTCRPTSSWPTRRSTSRTGRATSRRPALEVRRAAGRQRQLRLDPAHHLQARRPAAAPAWSWPTGRCRHATPAGGRDPRRSMVEADLVVVHGRAADRSCSARPASRSASGSSPRTRPLGQADRSTGPGRCCSSTPATSATWSTAPSVRLSDDDIATDRRHLPRLARHGVGCGSRTDVRGRGRLLLLGDAGRRSRPPTTR